MFLNNIRNLCLLTSFYLGTFSTSLIYASSVSCGEIKSEYTGREGKNYVFTAEQKCTLKKEVLINYEKIEKVFIKSLQDDRSYEKIEVEENSIYQNEPAIHLDLVQNKNTKHGRMILTGDMHIVYNAKTQSYKNHYITRKIKASGNAANTKAVEDLIILSKEDDHFSFSAKRTIKVKKPFIAPKNLFISEARKGLKKDLPTLVSVQLTFITD